MIDTPSVKSPARVGLGGKDEQKRTEGWGGKVSKEVRNGKD